MQELVDTNPHSNTFLEEYDTMFEWTNSIYKQKMKKPVFKGFFYYSRTSPVEHRKLNKKIKIMDWKQSMIKWVMK